MIGRALIAALLLTGCSTTPNSPENLFDIYMEAYADGDGGRLWELSTPAARADAKRLRKEVVAALTDPDAVKRVQVEGMFGATARDVLTMNDRQFFVWAVQAIRRRLGSAFVRRKVSAWRRVAVQRVSLGLAQVIYREPGGGLSQLPVRLAGDLWYVDLSPFPADKKAPEEKAPEEKAPEEPPADQPLQPDEEPWDPAQDE